MLPLTVLVAFLLAPFAASNLQAGEKISFSGKKTQVTPGGDKKKAESLQNGLNRIHRPSPYDSVMPRRSQKRRLTTAERRLKKRWRNEQDEKENWALLAPGELQGNEEYNFGVRALENDDTEENLDRRKDYTFYGLDKLEPGEETSGKKRAGNQRNRRNGNPRNAHPRQAYTSDPADDPSLKIDINAFTGTPQTEKGKTELGSHMASELNFKSLIPSEQVGFSAPVSRKQKTSMRQLLSGSQSLRSSPNGTSLGGSSPLLPSSSPGRTRLNGLGGNFGDPLNKAPDLTSRPLNPTRSQSALDGLNRGNRQGYGNSRISGFSSLPTPAAQKKPRIFDDFGASKPKGRSKRF